jgi:hypothetical protein
LAGEGEVDPNDVSRATILARHMESIICELPHVFRFVILSEEVKAEQRFTTPQWHTYSYHAHSRLVL